MKIIIFDNFKIHNQGLDLLLSRSITQCFIHTSESWPLSNKEILKIDDFDMVLLEISLIDPSLRYEEIKRYTAKHPKTPICVFTRLDPCSNLKICFEAGVHGFLHKTCTIEEIKKAINQILAGGTYLPSHLFGESSTSVSKRKHKITSRQKEILNLLSQGDSNQMIATKLGINVGTVKQHFHHIFKIFAIKNRVEALQYAIRDGLIN